MTGVKSDLVLLIEALEARNRVLEREHARLRKKCNRLLAQLRKRRTVATTATPTLDP